MKKEFRGELQKILWERLHEQGFDNIKHFHESSVGSGMPFSHETVRRVFNSETHAFEPYTLLVVCKFLNYTPQEIRRILQTYTSDKHIWPMMLADEDDSRDHVCTIEEIMVVESFRALCDKIPNFPEHASNFIDMAGDISGLETRQFTDRIRRDRRMK